MPASAARNMIERTRNCAGGPRHVDDAGEDLAILVPGLAVASEVVLAAEPVVPDPRRMRHRRVDLLLHVGLTGLRAGRSSAIPWSQLTPVSNAYATSSRDGPVEEVATRDRATV